MNVVIDASVAIALATSPKGTVAWSADWVPIAPLVFLTEVLNVLIKAERTRRGQDDILEKQLSSIQRLGVELDDRTFEVLADRTLPLARRHRLSIFDATYLELALRLQTPLATLDEALRRESAVLTVPLV